MARPGLLGDDEISDWLNVHPAWNRDGARLTRTFTFETFVHAFGFMTQVALVAEKMDHHPDWTNVYNRVDVAVTTHDVGGLTVLDTELAAAMDAVAAT